MRLRRSPSSSSEKATSNGRTAVVATASQCGHLLLLQARHACQEECSSRRRDSRTRGIPGRHPGGRFRSGHRAGPDASAIRSGSASARRARPGARPAPVGISRASTSEAAIDPEAGASWSMAAVVCPAWTGERADGPDSDEVVVDLPKPGHDGVPQGFGRARRVCDRMTLTAPAAEASYASSPGVAGTGRTLAGPSGGE